MLTAVRRAGTGCMLVLALLGSAGTQTTAAGSASVHTVTIENMQFNPPQLSVHRSDRIVWVNKDLFPHTATAGSKMFDSGAIDAGGSWSYVADKAGKFGYSCTFHPTMKGTLTVQ
jgi:plastocyanin